MSDRDRALRTVEIAPGYRIARLIHGCWQLATDHGSSALAGPALHRRWREAIDAGWTTFDCADIYTGVERRLGRFLAELPDPSCVQVHTKYVPDRSALPTLDRETVARSIDRSLRRLGVEALDLIQFHWWEYDVPGWLDVAGWLDELRREGKIRHLGLTNFDLERVAAIVDAGIEVVSLQVQYSLLDRRPARELAPWCRERGIALLAYGTLAGGFLTERWLGAPEPDRESNRSQVKYRLIIAELGGWNAFQRLLAAAAVEADERAIPLAAAAVRWTLDRRSVAAAIVGTGRRGGPADSAAMLPDPEGESWPTLDAELAALPGPQGAVYGLERASDGPHARIMRTNLSGIGGER